MAFPAKKMERKYTYGDYLDWPADERWELIDGVPYAMTPSPSRRHQEISLELAAQFRNFFLDKPCQVYTAPFDVRLPAGKDKDKEVPTVVQPDLVVVCDRHKLDEKGCRGAPDLVVEILSPESAARDLKDKFRLYEHHRVKEYWVVHPTEKLVSVFKLGDNHRYGRPDVHAETDPLETTLFPELKIDLTLVFRE